MPEYDPGLPIGLIMYARLDLAEKQAIAWGNLAALLRGVR
jgi:hypothetical protein